jgi:hypothetical protein
MKTIKLSLLFISFLFIGVIISCNKEIKTIPQEISENIVIKKDSVKKKINLDSLDKANQAELTPYEDYWNKISVQNRDSTLWLNSEMRLDHRIFGYKKPNTKSQRLIFLSIFTNDVEGNPFECKYGSYYSTTLGEEKNLKYISTEADFVKTILLDHNEVLDTLYFERKWIEFEEQN